MRVPRGCLRRPCRREPRSARQPAVRRQFRVERRRERRRPAGCGPHRQTAAGRSLAARVCPGPGRRMRPGVVRCRSSRAAGAPSPGSGRLDGPEVALDRSHGNGEVLSLEGAPNGQPGRRLRSGGSLDHSAAAFGRSRPGKRPRHRRRARRSPAWWRVAGPPASRLRSPVRSPPATRCGRDRSRSEQSPRNRSCWWRQVGHRAPLRSLPPRLRPRPARGSPQRPRVRTG